MSRKRRGPVLGTCRLCGKERVQLSFEHVPPESAYNDQPVMVIEGKDGFSIGPDEVLRGRIQQRGAGGHTLCLLCNNRTGHWYADAFKSFVRQAGRHLQLSGGRVSLTLPFYLNPLRVLKQIVTMFFSINQLGFADGHPELVRFVLTPYSQFLPRDLRLFVFYNWEGRYRTVPIQVNLDIKTRRRSVFTELVQPPLGYVLTLGNTDSPHEDMCEITEWCRYSYSDFSVQMLHLPVLATHLFIGGDYRTKDQIYEEAGIQPPKSA